MSKKKVIFADLISNKESEQGSPINQDLHKDVWLILHWMNLLNYWINNYISLKHTHTHYHSNVYGQTIKKVRNVSKGAAKALNKMQINAVNVQKGLFQQKY